MQRAYRLAISSTTITTNTHQSATRYRYIHNHTHRYRYRYEIGNGSCSTGDWPLSAPYCGSKCCTLLFSAENYFIVFARINWCNRLLPFLNYSKLQLTVATVAPLSRPAQSASQRQQRWHFMAPHHLHHQHHQLHQQQRLLFYRTFAHAFHTFFSLSAHRYSGYDWHAYNLA